MIENCEVKGIQGAVSIEENAKAEIRSGKFYTVNTSGQQDAFYALYVSSSAEVTITGGEFSAPNVRTGLQIEGTSAVVSGDNDTGRPSGSVILKGGKFSGKAFIDRATHIREIFPCVDAVAPVVQPELAIEFIDIRVFFL